MTGKCAKLKANPYRPALSTFLRINIHVVNKIDFLRLQLTTLLDT